MLVMAFLIGACAPTSSASPSPSAPPPTTTPTAVPSISHEPSPDAIDLPARTAPLPPGTYTRTGFKPPITVTLGEGWFAGTLNDGFFDLQQDKGTPDVIAVQFARIDALVDATGATNPATSADEAARTIEANPGLTVVAHDESRLGGLTGFNVVVENTSGSHTSILDVAVGRLGIDSGRRLWISLFDTADGLLAVMVGGSIARWDHALAVAEPVLESVVIDGSR
jgi:hypothetical protein